MLGKLAGAWIEAKLAGPNRGAGGAILGVAGETVAKRIIPAVAAIALGGWAFKKWREHKRSHAAYPSEASPASPPPGWSTSSK